MNVMIIVIAEVCDNVILFFVSKVMVRFWYAVGERTDSITKKSVLEW